MQSICRWPDLRQLCHYQVKCWCVSIASDFSASQYFSWVTMVQLRHPVFGLLLCIVQTFANSAETELSIEAVFQGESPPHQAQLLDMMSDASWAD